jgi:organic radical activating enzyme
MTDKIFHPQGIEVDVVYGCNIKCPQCSHGSQFLSGYLSVEEFIQWCEPWAERIRPVSFVIIGGEPLLHPQLTEIVKESKRIWHDSSIDLYTNGTLPHRLTPELLESLQGTRVTISTKYYKLFTKKDYIQEINTTIKTLQEHNIHTITRNFTMAKWFNEDWIPLNNDPQMAFDSCWVRSCSQPIYKGKLYKCLNLEIWQKLYEAGKIDWHEVMEYQPLEPDCSYMDLFHFIENKKPCQYCKLCDIGQTFLFPAPRSFEAGYAPAKTTPMGLSHDNYQDIMPERIRTT